MKTTYLKEVAKDTKISTGPLVAGDSIGVFFNSKHAFEFSAAIQWLLTQVPEPKELPELLSYRIAKAYSQTLLSFDDRFDDDNLDDD